MQDQLNSNYEKEGRNEQVRLSFQSQPLGDQTLVVNFN